MYMCAASKRSSYQPRDVYWCAMSKRSSCHPTSSVGTEQAAGRGCLFESISSAAAGGGISGGGISGGTVRGGSIGGGSIGGGGGGSILGIGAQVEIESKF